MTSETAFRPGTGRTKRMAIRLLKTLRSRVWAFSVIGFSLGLVLGDKAAHSANNIENACTMMQQRADWHHSAKAASEKWQIPVPSILAIIRHESRFKARAAARKSSAYGFAQALDGTWAWYRKAAKVSGADRSNFADSVNFIAWYMTETRKRTGLPDHDVASHYLAYHEGHGGYSSTRWVEKPGLITIAHKVAQTAWTYEQQLQNCVIDEQFAEAPISTSIPRRKPFALSEVAATVPRSKPADRHLAGLSPGYGRRGLARRLH